MSMRHDLVTRKDQILSWIDDHTTLTEISLRLNCNIDTLKKYMRSWNIMYHGNQGSKGRLSSLRKTPSDVLVVHPKKKFVHGLRFYLIEIGREYRCVSCQLGPEWNDQNLVLEVDHINGVNYDHRPENLRFLCPNCHSQTPTDGFKGRSHDKESCEITRKIDQVKARYHSVCKTPTQVEQERKIKREADEDFKAKIIAIHTRGEVNFAEYGWVNRLAGLLGTSRSQVIGKRIRRLMPEFYSQHCFGRR